MNSELEKDTVLREAAKLGAKIDNARLSDLVYHL